MEDKFCPMKLSAELMLKFQDSNLEDQAVFDCLESSCAWWNGKAHLCAIALIAKQKHGLKKLFGK